MFQIDPTVLPHIEALESDHERQERLRRIAYEDYVRKLEYRISVYKKFNTAVISYATIMTVLVLVIGAGHG